MLASSARARISLDTVVLFGFAFQILFSAVCISPNTPDAAHFSLFVHGHDGRFLDEAFGATDICTLRLVCPLEGTGQPLPKAPLSRSGFGLVALARYGRLRSVYCRRRFRLCSDDFILL
jgi:hypothetical protein